MRDAIELMTAWLNGEQETGITARETVQVLAREYARTD
jgi:hypothetical protein